MPELPEVETVARGLRAVLPERRILNVRLGKTDFIDDPAALERDLPGNKVSSVRRHGKFMVIEFEARNGKSANISLFIHLGMTGQILICPPEARVAPHTHVFFELDDGREFRYTDVRRFGKMRILSAETRESTLTEVGFDPLEATEAQFFDVMRARRARIKALLLDQHVLSGIGNIYTDESLWRARIHPMRLGANLRDHELRRLYRSVRDVLNEAIRMRGSSVSDYVDSEGRRGWYQQRHRVYQRKGKKCFRCGALIRRAIVAGRSSYFCPGCQLAPRRRRRPGR